MAFDLVMESLPLREDALADAASGLVRVLCFGNALHGDDGFGERVFHRLKDMDWPAAVEVRFGGTAGLNALSLFEGCAEVIVVDALAPAGEPGRVRVETLDPGRFRPESADAHGNGVGYLLRAVAASLDPVPRITLVGAQMASLRSFVPALSPAMRDAVPEAVRCVEALLA